MQSREIGWLIVIVFLIVGGIWLALNDDYPIQQGLDLQGGLQVLLEADLPPGETVDAEQMNTVRQIISQRVNALGVADPLVQVEGDRRILVELPGISNPEQAIDLIQGTALLEFVNTGDQSLPEGVCIRTSLNEGQPSQCEFDDGRTLDQIELSPAPSYETILTGSALRSATVNIGQLNEVLVGFEMNPDSAQIFGAYTQQNIGRFLTIVLDKRVISSPRINAAISDSGVIEGNFTVEEAQNLALQLQYGSLPIPLKIESTRQIGATLGAASVASSLLAGAVGLSVVLAFMVIYYRLPGTAAAVALVIYALTNFALYKLLGVTMTLPAITGFLFSTGMAVDANILIFERMKEELRGGSLIRDAVEAGFGRAWTSIRDANIAALIVCFILWSFGRNFGASMVQGFALTLMLGVSVSMFTAIVVTRTFMYTLVGEKGEWLRERRWLLGA
jgi:protein-export membrane protein SecD